MGGDVLSSHNETLDSFPFSSSCSLGSKPCSTPGQESVAHRALLSDCTHSPNQLCPAAKPPSSSLQEPSRLQDGEREAFQPGPEPPSSVGRGRCLWLRGTQRNPSCARLCPEPSGSSSGRQRRLPCGGESLLPSTWRTAGAPWRDPPTSSSSPPPVTAAGDALRHEPGLALVCVIVSVGAAEEISWLEDCQVSEQALRRCSSWWWWLLLFYYYYYLLPR